MYCKTTMSNKTYPFPENIFPSGSGSRIEIFPPALLRWPHHRRQVSYQRTAEWKLACQIRRLSPCFLLLALSPGLSLSFSPEAEDKGSPQLMGCSFCAQHKSDLVTLSTPSLSSLVTSCGSSLPPKPRERKARLL